MNSRVNLIKDERGTGRFAWQVEDSTGEYVKLFDAKQYFLEQINDAEADTLFKLGVKKRYAVLEKYITPYEIARRKQIKNPDVNERRQRSALARIKQQYNDIGFA